MIGIEKLVPTLEDAARVIQLLPKNATGQLLTSYVTWIRGAVPCDGEDKELHYVLLDNGRSELAESEHCQDALNCIRCGACANVCPVYQTVGGHVFGHIYIGAIGIILTAYYHALKMQQNWSRPVSAVAPAWPSVRARSIWKKSSCICVKPSAIKRGSGREVAGLSQGHAEP